MSEPAASGSSHQLQGQEEMMDDGAAGPMLVGKLEVSNSRFMRPSEGL